jgi:UDP:flavonoid glycosyltransferase YjiC (YdhE family)
MRFLFSSVGSSGDVHPYAGIGVALRARGHDVAFISQPYFERTLTDAGLEFIPAGERFDLNELASRPEMMGAWFGSVRILRQYMIPQCGPAARVALDAIDRSRPDVVVAHHMAWGALWAAEKHGIPTVAGCLSPLIFVSREDRCVFNASGRETGRGAISTLRRKIARWGCRFFYDPPLNRLRRELGLGPLKEQFIQTPRRATVSLGLWSPHFRPPMSDDPENSRITGFVWFDRHSGDHAPEEIERFLDDGEPPVIFTLGTTAVHVAGAFYEAAAEACRLIGRRGLLMTGRPEYAPRTLPAGVRAFDYAPFSAVLPRGCATVHHGGIGTTGQALRAGRPTVIVPFAHDQFDNAARARRLGVSATIRRDDITPRSLAAALWSVLQDPAITRQAASLGAAINQEQGVDAAATAAEQAAGA